MAAAADSGSGERGSEEAPPSSLTASTAPPASAGAGNRADPPTQGLQDRAWALLLGLTFLILLGTGVLLWFALFTSSLDIVVSLLGLGGAFAWMGFLANLVTDETKNAARQLLEQGVVRWRWVFVGAALFFLFLFAPSYGSIILDSLQDREQRTVAVTPADGDAGKPAAASTAPLAAQSDSADAEIAAANGRHRCLVWLGKPWSRRTYSIKVSGLPERTVTVHALQRVPLRVPKDFPFTPGILVHASAALTTTLGNSDYQLLVSVRGRPQAPVRHYRGETVWVGYDDKVDVPEENLARWQIAVGEPSAFLSIWKLRPRSVRVDPPIREDDHVRIFLNQEEFWQGEVKPPYPHEVDLK